MGKKKIIVLTGAGVSAESGIQTFRDAGGLWEGYDVMEVATFDGWRRNRELVLKFYNDRRAKLKTVQPNAAHLALAELESKYKVHVITQNVDDLHERAGSSKVLHLHGELLKARSTVDENLVYEWAGDITTNDKCDHGSQLRPHIVWFGEAVPMLEEAIRLSSRADIFLIIGTSMQVYPAASLIEYVPENAQKYFIDPHPAVIESYYQNLTVIAEKATTGVLKVLNDLL